MKSQTKLGSLEARAMEHCKARKNILWSDEGGFGCDGYAPEKSRINHLLRTGFESK
jgi:hypothetical protein